MMRLFNIAILASCMLFFSLFFFIPQSNASMFSFISKLIPKTSKGIFLYSIDDVSHSVLLNETGYGLRSISKEISKESSNLRAVSKVSTRNRKSYKPNDKIQDIETFSDCAGFMHNLLISPQSDLPAPCPDQPVNADTDISYDNNKNKRNRYYYNPEIEVAQ